MAAFPKLVLTSAGIALQTKVQGGATLELTNIQMGSGQLNGQPIGPLTALISSNTTVPIQSGQAIGQNTYQVEGFFTNADLSAGFWWREIGIFANDPDNGEILYAYANAGDAGDYIPTVTDQRIEKYIYFSMTLANATTVTVTIPQTDTYVLQSTVGQANGVAGLGENGAVPVAQGGTGATTAQDAVVALGALFAIAAAAAYNSSGTYAIGDYCTNDGNLYKCNTPIESGETWTEAHWTTTTVAAELAELSSQLSNLAGGKLPKTLDAATEQDFDTIIPDAGELKAYRAFNPTAHLPPGYSAASCDFFVLAFCDPAQLYVRQLAFDVRSTAIWTRRSWDDYGERVWGDWQQVQTSDAPEVYTFPAAAGISGDSQYCKTQDGMVLLFIDALNTSEFSDQDLIGTMPVGFRPANNVYTAVAATESDGGYVQFAELGVDPDGDVTVYMSASKPRLRGFIMFPA